VALKHPNASDDEVFARAFLINKESPLVAVLDKEYVEASGFTLEAVAE
jgi:hypothetical protein